MGEYTGGYTRGNDPAAMFDESLRYLGPLHRPGVPPVDADFNDGLFSAVHQLRRIIETSIGDGSPNAGFRIDQSGITTTNNFAIKGGDGTDDGAGRLFLAGFPAALKADVDFTGAFAAAMRITLPQNTDLAPLLLTDSTANWTVNEHVGKTLTPDVSAPATTFTVASNTATTITVTAGDLTALGAISDTYRIELTTPSGGPRIDEVYLDLFLDEVNDIEDANLEHTSLSPSQFSAFRLVLRQFVRVKEGTATPAGHVDADGRQHYTLKLATLNRLNADPTIVTSMIVDERPVIGVGGTLAVREEDGTPVEAAVNVIRVPNGSLTLNGPGDVSLTGLGGGGGGGGALTGPVSISPTLTRDITAITPPANGLTGTDTDTLDFPDVVTTGQRFSFVVPNDYAGGVITVSAVYRMSTGVASPLNTVRVETQAEVFDIDAGGINTLAASTFTLTVPDGNTDVALDPILTIPDVSVTVGDTVEVFCKRLGGDGADGHTGAWRVIGFIVGFDSAISNRSQTIGVEFLRSTDEAGPTPSTIGTDTDAEDYLTGADGELKFTVVVPENWDQTTDPTVELVYAMSLASASTVRIATEGEIANTNAGTLDAIANVDFDFVTSSDILVHRTAVVRSLAASTLSRGDVVTLKIARRTAVGGNHPGSFRLISVLANFLGVAAAGGGAGGPDEKYLELGIFGNISGPEIDSDTVFPDLAGNFETMDRMTSTAASGRVDVAYRGRLGSTQSTIASIRVPLLGEGASPRHRLRVYVEGSGATPVFDTGIEATSAVFSETVILGASLSAQPAGAKRYHVVVEAHIDAGEKVFSGRPFVIQES